MKRRDDAYGQRLRRDKRSAAAALLTIVAAIPPGVAVTLLAAPGTQAQARGNPLYWLLLLPVGWWATSLASYEPKPVRFIGFAQLVAPAIAVLVAIAAGRMGEDTAPFWIAAGASAVAALGGWLAYRNSMLQQEGLGRP